MHTLYIFQNIRNAFSVYISKHNEYIFIHFNFSTVAGSLYILERVIRDEITWEKTEEDGRCRLNVAGKLWLDFERDTDQVVTVVLKIKEENALKGKHYTGSLSMTHPSLEKVKKII